MGRSVKADPKLQTFPVARFKRVRDTDQGRNCFKFFKYWIDLAKPGTDFLERVQVKAYRLWPIVDLRLTEPSRKDIVWKYFEGACPFDDPHAYSEWFLTNLGSGEWRLILNERDVSGLICEAFFGAIDLENFPPLVDLQTVVWDAERNKTYRRYLQSRNIAIPNGSGTEGGENEDEDMNAIGEVVQKLTESNERLVNRVLGPPPAAAEPEETEPEVEDESEPRPLIAPGSLGESALAESLRVIGSATDKAVQVMERQVDRISAKTSEGHDPYSGVERVFGLIERVRQNENSEMATLVNKALDQNERHMQWLRERDLHGASAAGAPPAADTRDPITRTLDDFDKLDRVMERMQGFGRGRRNYDAPPAGPAPEPRPSFWESAFKVVSENPALATTIIGGVTTLAGGLFNMIRGGNGERAQQSAPPANQHGATPPGFGAPAPAAAAASGVPGAAQTPPPWDQQFLMWIAPAFLDRKSVV